MIQKTKNILFVLLCLCFADLSAQMLLFEQQCIGGIEIQDATDTHDENAFCASVLSRMCLKPGSIFTQSDFDCDLKLLAQEYDHVEPTVQLREEQVWIKLKIWPKPVIRCIRWFGNEKITTDKLQKELGIRPACPFNRVAFNQAFQKLKQFYIKKGFFESNLSFTVTRDTCDNVVDIDISICEGRCGVIRKICFENFTDEEECEILNLMVTKLWNFYLGFFTDQGLYREEMVQHDQFQIINYMQNKGFADAKVDIQIFQGDYDDRIWLKIILDRGEAYRFGHISFEGNKVYSNEEIIPLILAREGCPFSPEILRETATGISDHLGRHGFIDAFVDFELRLNPETRCYNVHFKIEEGSPYQVGLIQVFGNCRTMTKVILNECLLSPGEVFNIVKLKKTEERLNNIGFFKTVNVYAVRPEEGSGLGPEYRNIHIEVEETGTGQIGAFGGYSSVEAAFGGVNLTEKNFNIAGLQCLFSDGFRFLRGSGEYAHATVTIGQKNRSFVLSWTKPYFNDTPWMIGCDLEKNFNHYMSEAYTIDSWRATIHAKYPINYFTRFGWHYRIGNSDADFEDITYPTDDQIRESVAKQAEAKSKTGTVDLELVRKSVDENIKERNTRQTQRDRLIEEASKNGLISATGVSLTYDSTNNANFATCGFRSIAAVEFAGIGGRCTFLSVSYLNSYYIMPDPCGVLKFRADLRFIQPIMGQIGNEIPLDERLFLGGDTQLRGFRAYAIGPKFPGDGAPRGGLSMILASLEYVRPLNNRFDAFAFFDTGLISAASWRTIDFNGNSPESYKYSLGFGARVKVFENGPPLVIGMGFPLNASSRSEVKRFFFALGSRF